MQHSQEFNIWLIIVIGLFINGTLTGKLYIVGTFRRISYTHVIVAVVEDDNMDPVFSRILLKK